MVDDSDISLKSQKFSDMYELLAYVSGYVHLQTLKEQELSEKLRLIKNEDGDGPFSYDEAKQYLDKLIPGK